MISRAASRLAEIGFRPILLTRYVTHSLVSRAGRERLRRRYPSLIASVPPLVELRAPNIDLPRLSALPDELRGAAGRLRLEAEAILRHEVDYLGSGPVALEKQIDWHRDFKSGFRWPLQFYQEVQVTRLDDSSDAKVPWELSRGHQLLTLARAARLFDEERYLEELETQLGDWIDKNPAGLGINWTNSMEVALRAVNWVWAIRTAEGQRPLGSDVRTAAVRSLQAHGRHVAANLEGSPYLRSNHYLADVLGLLVLGWALPGDPASRRWLRYARRAFEREVLAQVHEDGVSFEASLSYHGLALEMLLLARLVATWAEAPFSARYDERLRRMLEVSRTLRHPEGRIPQFGDNDSGRVLPAGFARPPSHDHLLWLGGALLGGKRPLSGPAHEEVAWTLGFETWRCTGLLPLEEAKASMAFGKGGLFALREGRTHVAVRCGDVGQNGNGGHAHDDLASFEASFDAPLVVDAGTYVYTADPAARDRFRSATAHNVLIVDEHEPNPIEPNPLFKLRPRAEARLLDWCSDGRGTLLRVGHDGFRLVPGGGDVMRTFALSATGELSVVDEVQGAGRHDLSLRLQLAPSTVVARDDHGSLHLRTPTGAGACLTTGGLPSAGLEEFWVSDRYGARERAPVLTWRWRGGLPTRTELRLSPLRAGEVE